MTSQGFHFEHVQKKGPGQMKIEAKASAQFCVMVCLHNMLGYGWIPKQLAGWVLCLCCWDTLLGGRRFPTGNY